MAENRGAVEVRRWYDGVTRYHILVLVVASCGWLFDTMDQWLYVLARQPAIADLLAVSPGDPEVARVSGIVQALFIIGWATGGFAFGMVGDRLGRTRTMIITVLMYAGFTGLSGLSRNVFEFGVFRFLTGLGIGGEFAAGASLVAEVFPQHARPTALGIMQASSALGNILAGLINFAVAPAYGWRWVFGVGVLPALLVVVIRMAIREPERWQRARQEALAERKGLGTIRGLFATPELRRSTLVGVGLAAVGVIGFWGIGTWSPDLLRNAVNPENLPALKPIADRQVSLAVMAQNAGAFFGILAWAWLAQRIGRKLAFAATFVACTAVVPAVFHLTSSFTHALLLFPMMGFFTTALFGGYAVYFPELYPTRLRATGTGFCYNVARYLAAAGPYTFGALRGAFGIQWAATLLSGVFVLGLAVLPFARETKGQPLPED